MPGVGLGALVNSQALYPAHFEQRFAFRGGALLAKTHFSAFTQRFMRLEGIDFHGFAIGIIVSHWASCAKPRTPRIAA